MMNSHQAAELAKAMTLAAAQVGAAIETLIMADQDGGGPFDNHELPRPQYIDNAEDPNHPEQAHAFLLELADGSTYRVSVMPLTGPKATD